MNMSNEKETGREIAAAVREHVLAEVTPAPTPPEIPAYEPMYPQGTPEYDAYAAELRTELAKWVADASNQWPQESETK